MTAAPPPALLQATDLACRRGGRVLFAGLNLSLHGGDLVHLRGVNGAGKTSLLRLLAGVAQAEQGRVERAVPALYIGHGPALSSDLTLLENLAFLAALGGQPADPASLQQALQAWGLQRQGQAPVHTLSQGQRRRGSLARLSLPQAAAVWLLDEPHTALDSQGVSCLDLLLASHARQGGAVLLTCHHALDLPGLAVRDLHAHEPAPATAAWAGA